MVKGFPAEFPEIKELLGKGYLSKPVNGIVIGMSAGDVSKCVVRWKSSTSDQHIDLPMSTRKLNNLFHPTYAGSRDMKSTPCNARTVLSRHFTHARETKIRIRIKLTETTYLLFARYAYTRRLIDFSSLQLLHMNINCLYSKIALNKRNTICKNDDFDHLYL